MSEYESSIGVTVGMLITRPVWWRGDGGRVLRQAIPG